jgi:iron complex transport system ATP-binding protein
MNVRSYESSLSLADGLMQDDDSVIVFESLGIQRSGKNLLHAVSGRFQAGRLYAILGPNGAGKSTLLGCLSKEYKPSSGRVVFNGRGLEEWSFKRLAQQRAVLTQQQELGFSLTVEALVGLGFAAQDRSPTDTAASLHRLLAICDLAALRQRDYLTLSGGEQRRAQLARVLAQIWPEEETGDKDFAGKWLLLDEWSEGLDLKHQLQLGNFLRHCTRRGLGVVMVVHDLNQAMRWADECLLLENGRVYAQGPALEVMTPDILQGLFEVGIVRCDLAGQARPVLFVETMGSAASADG